MSHNSPSSVTKTFGFWTATALVLGNMIGSGVFFLPASLAKLGPISIFGWIITAIGALSLAYVFAVLTRFFPKAGGPYTHTQRAFGDIPGFMMAWGYWIMSWSSNVAIALAFVSYLSHFVPILAENHWYGMSVALGLVWMTTFINCLGIRYGGIVQVITVLVKISPLFIVGVLGLLSINTTHYFPINTSGQSSLSAINAATALTMWAFIGLEAATVPADNVSNPARTIARATLFGTGLGALLYIITTLVLFGLIPTSELANSHAPFVTASTQLLGAYVAPIIGICVLCSIYGGLNGWILVQGQIPYSLAKEGMFPKVFLKTSANGTPIFGLVFSSLLISIVMVLNFNKGFIEQFNTIILVGAVMTLIAYIFASLSAFKLLPDEMPNKKLPPKLVLAALIGISYGLIAIYGAGVKILNVCMVAYALGIPVYLLSKRDCKTYLASTEEKVKKAS
jgi:basic amino acid/polyamine antiporter, APA family